MDLADLETFEAVARTGGITRAARELHTVQSNVTARVIQLERELGVPLFRRHSRGVTPTAAGRELLPYAVKLRVLLDEAPRRRGGRRAERDAPGRLARDHRGVAVAPDPGGVRRRVPPG